MADLKTRHGSNNPAQLTHQGDYDAAIVLRDHLIEEFAGIPGLTNAMLAVVSIFVNDVDELILNMIRANLRDFTAVNGQLAYNGVVIPATMLLGGSFTPGAPQALGGGQPNPAPTNVPTAGPQLDADLLAASQAVEKWARDLGMSVQDVNATLEGIVTGMVPLNASERTESLRLFGRALRQELRFARGGNAKLQVEEDLDTVNAKFGEVSEIYTELHAVRGDRRNLMDAIRRVIASGGNVVPKADLDQAKFELAASKRRISVLEGFIHFMDSKMSKIRLATGFGRSNVDADAIVKTDLDPETQARLADPTKIVTPPAS